MGKRLFYFFSLLALLIYFAGMFIDVTGDASKYATVSREILESGDWLRLTLGGEPYLQKPPLVFWLAAISMKAFGLSNFAYKLPSVLIALLGVWATYRLTLIYYDQRHARLAAWLLMGSQGFFFYNMDVHTDITLMGLVAFSIWQITAYLKFRKWPALVLGFLGIAAAMLTKGPVGLAVPAIVIGTALALQRRWRDFFRWEWLLGTGLLLLFLSPALYGLYQQFGWKGIGFYFWTNNVGRITGEYASNNNNFLYYFPNLAFLLLPWSIIAFSAFFLEGRSILQQRFRLPASAEAIGLPGPFLFFILLSVASFKSPHYILPVVPLLCLTTARWLIIITEKEAYQKWRLPLLRLEYFLVGGIWLFILLIVLVTYPIYQLHLWLAVLLFASATLYAIWKSRTMLQKLLIPASVSILCLNLILNTHFFPFTFRFHSGITATRLANELAEKGETVYQYDRRYYESYFYSETPVRFLEFTDQLEEIIPQKNKWLYTTQNGWEELQSCQGVDIQKAYRIKHFYLSQPRIGFLFPQFRGDVLEERYLVKF